MNTAKADSVAAHTLPPTGGIRKTADQILFERDASDLERIAKANGWEIEVRDGTLVTSPGQVSFSFSSLNQKSPGGPRDHGIQTGGLTAKDAVIDVIRLMPRSIRSCLKRR